MSASPSKSTLGFYTVVDDEQFGLTGGYLVLNGAGRPLEFHCTVPLKPNRAQQILYGPTLKTYLYGEQIGQTLLAKGSSEPLVICVDIEPALALRPHVAAPVVLVKQSSASSESSPPTSEGNSWRVDGAHGASSHLHFHWGNNQLLVPAHSLEDRETSLARFAALETMDLAEPFGRIREAIAEAQRGRKTES
jgi:hypothetical protein